MWWYKLNTCEYNIYIVSKSIRDNGNLKKLRYMDIYYPWIIGLDNDRIKY